MEQITTFKQVNHRLANFIGVAGKQSYSLERMKLLMEKLGNPQDKLKVIHVAGTSGKTSTGYYIASLLVQAGSNVGLSVSPHIDEINERIQLNLNPIEESEFCSTFSDLLEVLREANIVPTYFEILVAMAYWYFDKVGVDYVVMEVGMGGLLDGTNVVTSSSKVCVITDIGLDHTKILGDTLEAIARQKAGIILADNRVFMNAQSGRVNDVIADRCREVDAKLYIDNEESMVGDLASGLVSFQSRNFALALRVVDYIQKRDKMVSLTNSQIAMAKEIKIPARMQEVTYKGKTVILDGSHNKQKIEALAAALKERYSGREFNILAGFSETKANSVAGSLNSLKQVGDSIWLTGFDSKRKGQLNSMDIDKLNNLAKESGFRAVYKEDDPVKAFNLLIDQEADVYLVTGSFYLLNHIRPLINDK